MQKLSVCANKKNRKAILELLQSMGCMQITTEGIDDPDLKKMDTQAQRSRFEKSAQMFDQALELLDQYAPEKSGMSLFSGKEEVSREKLNEIQKHQQKYIAKVNRILSAQKDITEHKGTILKDENQITVVM